MPLRPDMELNDYLEIFRRRKWYIAFSVIAILFGASVLCVALPEKFKSSTTILVIPQRVPEGYVRSTISTRVEEHLFTLRQQVLSRTRLLAVMDELGLYKEERKNQSIEGVVEKMRKGIEIQVASATTRRQGGGEDAFTLTFVHENPQMAMLTASRLASFFIDENMKNREQQAVGTADFLESQLRVTKAKLERQEEKVKQYKLRFSGELPQQLQANLQILSRLQEQMRTNSNAIRNAQDRKVYIEAQIGALEAQVTALAAQPGSRAGTGDLFETTQDEIAAKKAQLANMSAKYNDAYPEVRRLKDEIARLEKRLGEEQGKPSAATSRIDNTRLPRSSQGTQGLRSREREEILRLKAQNTALDAEIASLKKDYQDIRKSIEDLEAKVEKSPTREQEMISLTRDYENLKQQYDDLLKKRLDAQVFQNLEKRQKGEQFQILDPADLPQTPFSPNRPKVIGIALALALVVGFGGAIGIEMLNPALRGKRDFHYFFQLPVLASIPILRDEEYERRKNRNLVFVYSGLVSFTLALTIFLVVFGHKVRILLLGSN